MRGDKNRGINFVSNLDSVRFGTLRKLLCAIGVRSHGYELHKKTGLSLKSIYQILPILVAEGIIVEVDHNPIERRRYVALTDRGKMLAGVCSAEDSKTSCRIPYLLVLFDLDGVIFRRPWDDPSDHDVSISTWDLLFKRMGAYVDHERLKKDFKNANFESYNEWTEEACRFLKAKGLNRTIFEEVINLRKYNLGVKETIKTLLSKGIIVGVVTGSFYELAERVKEELGLEIHIDAHCHLEFDERGLLKHWQILSTDYKDKATLLKFVPESIPLGSIAYVGDDVNDIAIFGKVGLSIAFNAIKEEVKKAADVVVDGSDLRKVLPHLMTERHSKIAVPQK
jgi:phosphoserine phosphatase